MNEGVGGKVYDLSGNGNTGAITNALWVPSKFGPGLEFDASGDYINCGPCGGKVFQNGNPVTIVTWVRIDSVGQTAGRIVDKATSTAGPMLTITATSTIHFQADAGIDVIREASDNSVTYGQYSHIAVTWDGSLTAANVHIYINGRECSYQTTSDGTVPFVNNAAANLYIGNNASSALRCFDGVINYVMIYNRTLSATEVQQLYIDPFGMFRREPIEIWGPAFAGALGIYVYDTE
jgi:hypothetical protein